MPLTRDEDFPAEAAALMAAFNRCADGHDTLIVLEATANMLIAIIGGHTRQNGGGQNDAIDLAMRIGATLPHHVAEQWDRQRQVSDVDVPLKGNA